jgi:acetyl esterase/lipase
MRSRFALPALLGFALAASGQQVVPLYPGAAPGSETWNWPETEQPASDGIRRIANVTKPTLMVFLPDKAKATGTGMVICPGGGFRILAWNHEGEDVARFLNELGVAAFVLKYRVMRTGDEGEKDKEVLARRRPEAIALGVADGLEAMRLVRRRAAEWGVRPERLGIMGFSAGGWVTTGVVLQGTADSRPNFAAPIYAAMPETLAVPSQPPPLFLVHADDDTTVRSERTSIRLYTAWKQAGASAEMHIYAKGGHGFGMRKKSMPVDSWTLRLRDWLEGQGLLSR